MRTLWAGWVLLATAGLANGDEPFLDPYTVRSADGGWSLRVSPSASEGEGPATYQMTRNGSVVWTAMLPWSLRESVITAAGDVAGYAYSNGAISSGEMIVAFIDPRGEVRTEHRFHRDPNTGSCAMGPEGPDALGILLDDKDPSCPEFTVRTCWGSATPRWLTYSMRDGLLIADRSLAKLNEGPYGVGLEIDAEIVPGTGLTAVHWYTYDAGVQGACFQLIDKNSAVAWTKSLEHEYRNMPEHWHWRRLISDRVDQLAPEPGGFSITSYSLQTKVTYRVLREGDMWKVDEVSTVPGMPSEPSELATSDLAPIALVDTGRVPLQSPISTSPFVDAHQFTFDDRKRMGWVRRNSGSVMSTLIIADQTGKIVSETLFSVPPIKESSREEAAWIQDDRWVIWRTEYTDSRSSTRAWMVDASTGKSAELPELRTGRIDRIVPMPSAGFAALTQTERNDQLIVNYDLEGRRRVGENVASDSLGLIHDIAVLSDGTLAILSSDANKQIELRTPAGERRQVDMKSANEFTGSHKYIADIRADHDGGFVLLNSANENQILRITKEGGCWQEFHARGPKNEKFRLYTFEVDPDGRVWGTDGTRIYRFGNDGVADLVLGEPQAGGLGEIAAVRMGKDGRIYALESGTAAMHLFSPEGVRMNILTPKPGDTSTQRGLPIARVDDDGAVRWALDSFSSIVSFDAQGKQGPTEQRSIFTPQGNTWEPVRGGTGWESDGTQLRQRRPDGSVARTLKHRADGAWFVEIKDAAVLPCGLLAVVSEQDPRLRIGLPQAPQVLSLFSATGDPVAATRLPEHRWNRTILESDGRIVVASESNLCVYDRDLKAPPKFCAFTAPNQNENWWTTMSRPDGSIALWASGERELRIVRLPERGR